MYNVTQVLSMTVGGAAAAVLQRLQKREMGVPTAATPHMRPKMSRPLARRRPTSELPRPCLSF